LIDWLGYSQSDDGKGAIMGSGGFTISLLCIFTSFLVSARIHTLPFCEPVLKTPSLR